MLQLVRYTYGSHIFSPFAISGFFFFFFFAPVGGLLLTANLVYGKEAKNVPRRLDTRDTFFAYASQVLSDFLSYLISLHRQCFLCACNRSLAHVRPSLGASMLVLGVAVTD